VILRQDADKGVGHGSSFNVRLRYGIGRADLLCATGVKALTMQECSANYKAAKSAGTLNGKTWSQFRKEECGSTAAATQPAGPSKNPPAKADAPQVKGNTVFPTTISPTY
jgi:hypothetical protein